jgi:hypothetical protein
MSNTFPNFLLKSDITVRHSVVSLPTNSTLHWHVKRFRAKKFLVRASSSMNMTLAFAVSMSGRTYCDDGRAGESPKNI